MINNFFTHRLYIISRFITGSIYRLLGPLNKRLQPGSKYSIKAGYHAAKHVEVFNDYENKDEWQRTVYESALELLIKMDGHTVIDVGCGSGFKLVKLFGNYHTTGIELASTCEWLVRKYPSGIWYDFEKVNPAEMVADLVICSDVIEHVKNPDSLMDFLKKIQCRHLLISTPERDSIRGLRDFGPPQNTSHFREWNKEEFCGYVSRWFSVDNQIISRDKSPSQILFCRI